MEKKNLEREYFLDLLNNKIRRKSISTHDNFFGVAREFIQLNRDIQISSEKTSSLLEKSRENYKELLAFSIKKNILFKYKSLFQADFKELLKVIQTCPCDYEYLGIVLNTFLKKVEKEYFKAIHKLLDSNERVEFEDIKTLVDDFFQEIIIREIPIETVKPLLKKYPEEFLLKLNTNLNLGKAISDDTYVLLKINTPDEIRKDTHFYLNEILFTKLFDNNYKLINNNHRELSIDVIKKIENKVINENIPDKYSKKKSEVYIINLGKVNGFDNFSKIIILEKMLDNNFKYFHMMNSQKDSNVCHPLAIIYNINTDTHKLYMIPKNTSNLLKNQTNKFIKDKNDFLNEFIQISFNGGQEISTYQAIFRLINLLDNSDNLTPENQLIILWSCMEKIIINIEGGSIIQKVVKINQQANVMYSIKNKMNIIWHEIIRKDMPEVLKIFDKAIVSKEGGRSKYTYDPINLIDVIQILSDDEKKIILENSKTLGINILEFEKIILKSKTALKTFLRQEEDLIKHEFTRIYRHRNLLVHTNIDNIDNIYIHIQILQKYLYALLSILIHYTLRNNTVSIKDILYSIDLTYKRFWEKVESLEENFKYDDIYRLIKFEYLFL